MGHRSICLMAAVILLAASPASAQFIDQNRADRRAPAPARNAPAVALPAPAVVPAITPFTLTAVQVSGVSVPPALIEGATRGFIGRQVDAAAITQITKALADAYEESQVALYTVVAPQQDFAGGVLKLTVVEGYVQNVDLQGAGIEGRDLDLIKAYAARLTAEKPLRRRTLQRYVSLIRDIPGLKVDIQLLAGDAPGALVMAIKLDQKDFQAGLNLNNNGNALLGRTQVGVDLTAYGLLRQGQQTTLSLGTATTTGFFQFASLTDAEPIGDDGTVFQATGSYIHTKTRGLNILGNAQSLQFLVTHPLVRSFDENLYLTGALDGLDSTNALLGQTLATEKVRALRAAASYSLSSADDLISASATLSQGLDLLGARIAAPGVLDFQKLNLNLGYNRLFWSDWVLRLKGTSQLAGQRLPISELLSLGGPEYGRAFALSSIIGDSGVAASAEWAWHPQDFPIEKLRGSEVYGFMDRAETWFFQRGVLPRGTAAITSAGGGVRLALFGTTDLGLEAARQLAVPAGFRHGWAFNVSLRSLN